LGQLEALLDMGLLEGMLAWVGKTPANKPVFS
jgi:hypothetical protein